MTVNAVIILDDQRRGVFPEPFRPGDRLVVDSLQPDAILLHRLDPGAVPLAEPRWVNGRLFGAQVDLTRDEIAAAVREERDAR